LPILLSLSPVLFTHLVTCSLTVFVLIKSFSAWQGLNFIIAFVGLLPLLIYLISAISLLLYNCCKYIKLTISHFSCVILSLTKQLYRDFESVQRVIGSYSSCRIFLIIALITALVFNPYAILYSLDAKTLYITCLYLIDD
jgi:hypothetical protein